MKLEQHLKNHEIHAWNTGAMYTEKGQRIAAIKLPDDHVYFYDIDRHIDGVSDMPMTRAYMNIKEFVTRVYDYHHYRAGYYSIDCFSDAPDINNHEDLGPSHKLRGLLFEKANAL